jgi:hypothetical protein
MASPENGQRNQHTIPEDEQNWGESFASASEIGEPSDQYHRCHCPVKPRPPARGITARSWPAGEIGFGHKRGSVEREEMRVNPHAPNKIRKASGTCFLIPRIVEIDPLTVASVHDGAPPLIVRDIPADCLEQPSLE